MPPPPRPTDPGEPEGDFTAWPLVIAIGTTKLITVLVVLLSARDRDSLMLTGPTLLPWIAVAFGLLAAPVAWQIRLRRARRRRGVMLREEWRLEDPASTSAPTADIASHRVTD